MRVLQKFLSGSERVTKLSPTQVEVVSKVPFMLIALVDASGRVEHPEKGQMDDYHNLAALAYDRMKGGDVLDIASDIQPVVEQGITLYKKTVDVPATANITAAFIVDAQT